MNLRQVIQYDGTGYSGWQRVTNAPKNKPTIQFILEERFSDFFGTEIKIIGAGRTDAGVHAFGQAINFHIAEDILMKNFHNYDLASLTYKLNSILPDDIKVCFTEIAAENFHSRLSAIGKTYEYRIESGIRESVFRRRYVWYSKEIPDVNRIRLASRIFIGTHDFKAFSSEQNTKRSTIRTIQNISIMEDMCEEIEGETVGRNTIAIRITGDGFLYHMVRIIVGTLLETGLLKRDEDSIRRAFSSKERCDAGGMLGPQGLILKEVFYI